MEISDIKVYQQRMRATIVDKLFWVQHIFEPVSQLVDLGCADGTLLKVFREISPSTQLIAVDTNSLMLKEIPDEIEKYTSLADVPVMSNGSVLNLSSVLHEIYFYMSEEKVDEFWDDVIRLGPDYITIRDMYYDEGYDNFHGYAYKTSELRNKIMNSPYAARLARFEQIWGKTTNAKAMVHFLLKYKFEENWEREVEENYFSWNVRDVMNKIKNNYYIVFCSEDALPYFNYKVREDFGTEFSHNTHIKLILKKIQ